MYSISVNKWIRKPLKRYYLCFSMSLLFIQWHRQFFFLFPSFIHHTFLSKFHNATILWYIFACGTCFFMEAVAKYFHTILCFRVLTFALINQFTHYCRELRLTSAQIIPGCVIHTGYACASFILSMGLKVNKNNVYLQVIFFGFKVYFRLLDKKCPSQMSVIFLVPFIPLSWVNVLGKIGWTEICFLL